MNIEFRLDENMPFAFIEFLRNKGYKTEHLKKLGKSGIRNGEVYQVAEEKEAWILTRDSDFKSYHKFVTHSVEAINTQIILNSFKNNLIC
jgi:predicted nuclease of predicted toxin-antitoxin system